MFHIHRYRFGPRYDEKISLSNLSWKRNKTCRCGKFRVYHYTWGYNPVWEGR